MGYSMGMTEKEAQDHINVELEGEASKCCSAGKSPVVCRDCDKTIGVYEGEGQVIGICNSCYEALN